jgi:hypothetical protein
MASGNAAKNKADDNTSKKQKADMGNASNPSPEESIQPPGNTNQYLNKQAEKYLREAGNIEDMPDAEEQKDVDETIEKGKKR